MYQNTDHLILIKMAKKKIETTGASASNEEMYTTSTNGDAVQFMQVIPTPIIELSVDFPSEGLNNMARKINEIIMKVNTL